jgi:D-alanyl-D-alanine carboxypeptidase/D-alanyl-D-alanine-endopeptidase (penicillin-binding protein 4)
MIIDDNRIRIVATPTEENHTAHIAIDTKYPYQLDAITNNDESLIQVSWQGDIIHITGNINASDQEYKRKLAPKNLNPFIIDKIQSILNQLNIKGKIEIAKDKIEPILNLALINQHLSKPLKDIIQPAMKLSTNSVFDSIYLTIVNSKSDQPVVTWSQAHKVARQLLQEHLNLDKNDIVMVDGSGLSRYNKIKPESLFAILRQNYHNNNFLQLLPAFGEDSTTLEHRNLINIIAKTGHMLSINNLCGYKLGAKPYAFVIVANGFSSTQNDMDSAVDQFINDTLK